jgi:hypothetical protein
MLQKLEGDDRFGQCLIAAHQCQCSGPVKIAHTMLELEHERKLPLIDTRSVAQFFRGCDRPPCQRGSRRKHAMDGWPAAGWFGDFLV